VVWRKNGIRLIRKIVCVLKSWQTRNSVRSKPFLTPSHETLVAMLGVTHSKTTHSTVNRKGMSDINKLILGDNLEILRTIETESVDLIYLDPPFFSNRNYEIIWGDSGEVRSFEDRFSGGIDHYIGWLKERVIEMHRILKQTGSIFLHCDHHANAYIRVQVLDKLFGESNFKNEIIWHYSGWNANLKDSFNKRYDTIFFYTKSKKQIFNGFSEKWQSTEEYVKLRKQKVHIDENGQQYVHSDGGNGTRVKRYLEEALQYGKPICDVWIMDKVNNSSKEKIGYPTQKPEILLDRIIKSVTNENDLILDPFVGGGTTVAVADKLNRKWIGIDQSVAAIKVTEARMTNQQDLFAKPFVVQLHKYDYDTLRFKDAFEFEIFIVTQFGGINNTKQRGDLGLDGKTRENQPIQVKRSDGIGRNVVDNFLSAVKRNDKSLYEKNKAEMKPVGFIIAFSFGKGAVQEVARLKNEENIIIKLVTVEEIIPIAKKPKLTIEIADKGTDKKNLREIEFVAKGESEAGIEFFMWDFDYKNDKFNPEIMFDKKGEQSFNTKRKYNIDQFV
jgi:DNA modification methylase